MDFELSKEQKDIVKAAREFAKGNFLIGRKSLTGTSPLMRRSLRRQLNWVLWGYL